MSKNFQMSLEDIVKQRAQFQAAPNTVSEPELPLLEKQAIIDEILRGMPLREFQCAIHETPNGPVYFVTKGWSRLCALFDFVDGKFATWTDADMIKWQRQQKQ